MNPRLPYLREKTAKLTASPGVYIMRRKDSSIKYIGKAKNLHNRVSSYFRENPDHTPKVAAMVSNVYDYDFFVSDSEFEALLLECSLIKEHKPMYMSDWIQRLDDFLNLSGKELLQHAGTISAQIAKEKADSEYDKFEARTRNELSSVELHFIENFERERLKLTSGPGTLA